MRILQILLILAILNIPLSKFYLGDSLFVNTFVLTISLLLIVFIVISFRTVAKEEELPVIKLRDYSPYFSFRIIMTVIAMVITIIIIIVQQM